MLLLCLSFLHNYFDRSTKLFLSLYLFKFLDISAKLFFLYNTVSLIFKSQFKEFITIKTLNFNFIVTSNFLYLFTLRLQILVRQCPPLRGRIFFLLHKIISYTLTMQSREYDPVHLFIPRMERKMMNDDDTRNKMHSLL